MSFKEAKRRKKSKHVFIAIVILTFYLFFLTFICSCKFKLPSGVISFCHHSLPHAVIDIYITFLHMIGPKIHYIHMYMEYIIVYILFFK